MGKDSFCIDFVSPHTDARIAVYDLAIGLPAFAFVFYLGWNIKASLRKLRHSHSDIMATYYGFLWAVSLLNILRCLTQIAQTGHKDPVAWNVMWLLTRFGMVLLEVSVVVFLLQGYMTTGREALKQTLVTSGTVAGIDTAIKAAYIFVFHVPLFLYGGTSGHSGADMDWKKWSFWLVHTLLFIAVYFTIVILPLTRWRDILPAKPSFYRYARFLLLLNVMAMVGAILIGSKVVSGYCVYGVATWLYYALYPPLLYVTFLAEFFADDQLDIDMMYYSEMREAGCFDDYDEEPLLY